MSIGEILYTIIIKPLELIFELIFAASYDIIPNPAVNLLIMSLAINLLVLPLYRRADIIQQQARKRTEELTPMMDHIKKYFKGDERVMIMQAFYRVENYSPLSSLKGMISLVLQIPFFIAAYQFLSHLSLLEGQGMGPISDLSQPDGLIVMGSITINLLPVLMTLINVISSAVYTKGQPFKDKIVLYLTAAVFLVLLYNSPSGLVFYWTLNNVFSLVKNLFFKLKNPGFVFEICCAATGAIGFVCCLIWKDSLGGSSWVFLMILSVAIIIPLLVHLLTMKKEKKELRPIVLSDKLIYAFSVLYLVVLTGLLIPSAAVASSPEEFIQIAIMNNPAEYVWSTLFIVTGIFVVWLGVYYCLSSDHGKICFSYASFVLAICASVDYFAFGSGLGVLSPELVFEYEVTFETEVLLLTTGTTLLFGLLFGVLRKMFPKVMQYLVLTGTVAVLCMGIVNIAGINSVYKKTLAMDINREAPLINLSKNGKNVIVFMLDRACGSYLPYILNEDPSLKDTLDGFTYYPNTLSFGGHTNIAAPALFGGYEYTPEGMNKRNNILLKDKHNESLLVMPTIFSSNGYDVTTIDMPYVNYSSIPQTDIFDGKNKIKAYNAQYIMTPIANQIADRSNSIRKRNFILYSLFKISPSILQGAIYNDGDYNVLNYESITTEYGEMHFPQTHEVATETNGINQYFMVYYEVLNRLSEITVINNDSSDNFLMMDNNSAHAPMQFQMPGYEVKDNVNNTEYYKKHKDDYSVDGKALRMELYMQIAHYQINYVSLHTLGEWFDYLRTNGVWDNTRIIVVADHGKLMDQRSDLVYGDINLDAEEVNPLLLVKDFGSRGFTTSDEFMTNADVPTLAMKDVISNPVNPFTGNAITNISKNSGVHKILLSDMWRVQVNNGYQFMPGAWYSVHDNIFDRANWEYLGEY